MSARRRRRTGELQAVADYLFGLPGDNLVGNLDELTGSVAFMRNTALALGRNVATLTYAAYVAGANWANPSGQIARHTAGAVATLQQDGIIAAGKTWEYVVVMSNRTAGSVTITGGDAPVSSNGTTTVTITATGADVIITPSNDFDGDLDLAQGTVKQTNIAAFPVANAANPFNGSITSVTIGQPGTGLRGVDFVQLYDGNNDYTDIYSAEINSFFNPAAGTLLCFARVANAGVWTDGIARRTAVLRSDGNNRILIGRKTTNNQLEGFFQSGGINKSVNIATTTTNWFLLGLTWDIVADAMIVYFNGVKQGSTQTGLGTWVGNLNSARVVIGADSTVPASIMSGNLAVAYLSRRVLTQAEIFKAARLTGLA